MITRMSFGDPSRRGRAADLGDPGSVVGHAPPVIGGARNFDIVCHRARSGVPRVQNDRHRLAEVLRLEAGVR
jgi:hypothetical protein